MILTIDVGTTNTKVSSWNQDTLDKCIKFKTPKIINNENTDFDNNQLWKSIITAIKELGKENLKQITKISIASVGESGVLLDDSFEQIGPMIAWYDQRTEPIVNNLTLDEKKEIYKITGLPAHVHYSASKIRWIMDKYNVEDTKKVHWLCIPDYLVFKFTGKLATEYSIASRTMCYDLEKKKWSSKIKEIFQIENVEFPQVYKSGEDISKINSKIAEELGISSNCTLTIAGHDHMVGSRTSGMNKYDLLDSTGTTEALLVLSNHPDLSNEGFNKKIANGIYVDPQQYTIFTALPSAGSVIQWFMNHFSIDEVELTTIMDELLDNYIKGMLPDNITWVIPHFNGSGTPTKSTETKGLWYGLNADTSKKDLVFGLFLGMTFEFKLALMNLTDMRNIQCIKVIGPASKDPLWLQLKADLLDKKVMSIDVSQAVSYGANLIANGSDKSNSPVDEIYKPSENNLVYTLNKVFENEYLPLYKAKTNFELKK